MYGKDNMKWINNETWPTLKSLSTDHVKIAFIEQNSQLECLNLVECFSTLIKDAAYTLPNLKELSFIPDDLNDEIIDSPSRFENLTKLGLYSVLEWDCGQLSGLSGISELRELVLSIDNSPEKRRLNVSYQIEALAAELPHLEIFHSSEYSIEKSAVHSNS